MTTATNDSSNGSKPTQSSDFAISEVFIAPWGLANEQRPIHLLWEGQIEGVRMQLPNHMDIHEVNNLAMTSEDLEFTDDPETNYREVYFDSKDLVSQGYLAGEIVSSKIFDEVMVGQKIRFIFELPDSETLERTEYTFTIRPEIELVDAPNQVVLEDNDERVVIEVDMRYIGFGMAEVEVDVQGNGNVMTEREDLLAKIAQALDDSGIAQKDSNYLDDIPEEWEDDPNHDIPKQDLQLVAEDLRKVLLEKEYAFENLTPDEMVQVAEALEEGETDREWDVSKMYEFLELALVNSILDIVDRHPTEGVKMENPNTDIETDDNTTEITLIYNLEDRAGNEYEEITHEIGIVDNREQPSMMRGEINTNWESHRINPDEILQEIMGEL